MKDKKVISPEIEREIYNLCYASKLGQMVDLRRINELFKTYPKSYSVIGERAINQAAKDYKSQFENPTSKTDKLSEHLSGR